MIRDALGRIRRLRGDVIVRNAQIILVFIASLMLFIKDMDEQDGAPGDMFKGPIFSYAMIVIGTLVLVATIYTILVET